MLFNLYNSKNGIIESVSIDLDKIDKDLAGVMEEASKSAGKIRVIDNHIVIVKTEITLEQLMKLNKDFLNVASDFIMERIAKKDDITT